MHAYRNFSVVSGDIDNLAFCVLYVPELRFNFQSLIISVFVIFCLISLIIFCF